MSIMGDEATAEPFDLSAADAAKFLGVRPKTIRAWADAGEIRGWRTPGGHWRFRRSDLERLVSAHTA